jgi:hypothetical protein
VRGKGHKDNDGGLNIIKIIVTATITITKSMRQRCIVEYIQPTRNDVVLTVDGNYTRGGDTPLPS